MRPRVVLALLVLAVGSCNPPAETVRPTDLRVARAGATALVVVYSRTGHTAQAGRAIAEVLGADFLRVQGRGGEGDSWFSTPSWESHVAVRPGRVDLSHYRLIVLGGPIWYWRPSALASSFLDDNDLRGKDVVLFYTFQGGAPSAATIGAWKARAVARGAHVRDLVGIDRKALPRGVSIRAEARRLALERRALWLGERLLE